MDESKFIWTVGEHTYILVPEVRFSERRTWLLGAGMYSLAGEYIGYWSRGNMPIPLIQQLTAHARKARAKEGRPAYQLVSAYKRRVPKR